VSLQNILVPIAQEPRAQPAIDAVVRIIEALHLPSGTVTLLHVGPSSEAPTLTVPEGTAWNWQISTQEGEPVEVILRTAADVSADLIVMTTGGRQGFLDALRGSTSERVLRAAGRPVLSLPVKANRNEARRSDKA
jgi:nucleotide-binding universal stress UspA family protein